MIRLRLSDKVPTAMGDAFKNFADIVQTRRTEADDFYQATTPGRVGEDEARVMRQALVGMLWSKQYFGFDVDKWLLEHGVDPKQIRNVEWFHMVNEHVISKSSEHWSPQHLSSKVGARR
jgi:hypothetical protein